MARTATALFLPTSFDQTDRAAVEVLFPSKLADYTAIGLPILIWGPRYSTAVRWGLANPSAALVCDEENGQTIRILLKRLRDDAEFRASLAEGALIAGRRDFSLEHSRAILYSALSEQRSISDRAEIAPVPPIAIT